MKHVAVTRSELTSCRRVGVEIELSGLTETAIAGTVMFVLGGQVRPATKTRVVVTDTDLGNVTIELDTKLDQFLAASPDNVLSLARQVIPTELITDPIAERDLPLLDRLVRELRNAGAEGSGAGVTKGFGVHFNPEVPELRPVPVLRVLQAYALLEPWLRRMEPMTAARRVLPFTEPWPVDLRLDLLDMPVEDLTFAALIDLYLKHAPSRNYGLDLLPLWRHLDSDRVSAEIGDDAPAARPTYHFRLPTSRIDERGWKITNEWTKWQRVERLARDPHLLGHLRQAWQRSSSGWLHREDAWVDHLDDLLPRLDPA